MPFPSSGCQTCKNRRIKCDGDQPICQKCKKSNRICYGSSNGRIGAVVHIENTYASGQSKRPRGPRSNAAANLTSNLGLNLRSPTIDLKSQAIAYYLHHHLQTMQDIPSISKSVSGDVLPVWNLRSEWPILDLAVSSLALAVFSRIRHHAPAAIEASKNYDQLLQILQVNILSLDAQNVDACLLAIFHMSRYEEAIHQPGHPNPSTTFNNSLRSFSHHDGALAILKIWSRQLKCSHPATNVIKHTRRGLIRSALLRNLTVPEWMRDGAKFGEDGIELEYDRLIVRIIVLRQQVSSLTQESIPGHHYNLTSVAQNLSKEALDIDIALQDWMNHFPKAWFYERHNLPVPHPWPMKNFWSRIVHSYPNPQFAAVWNQYYTTRMLINSTHVEILKLCHRDPDVSTSNLYLECVLNLKLMGDCLASSVPFCLHRFKVTKPPGSSSSEKSIKLMTEEEIKPFLATLLVWPLTVASSLRYGDIEQKTWFRSELAYLGKVAGMSVIEKAETDIWPEL